MRPIHDSASDSVDPESGLPAEGTGCVEAHRAFAHATEPDPLSDVLRTVRLTGALFFLWDVSWPYAMPVPDGRRVAPIVLPDAQQIISYHVITQGSCWCRVHGEPLVELHAGDILLIPHGDAYVMASAASGCAQVPAAQPAVLTFFRRMAAGELPFVIRDGGGGAEATRMVCGFLGCDVRPFNPMLAALPRVVRVRPPADTRLDRVHTLVDYTLAEAARPLPGSSSVQVRLAELLFVEVLRRYLAELPAEQAGWLAAMRDPTVGRALVMLHREPARDWTLGSLAEAVGISRSRLAECFMHLVGTPPMQYLAQWRIQLAARMLADGSTKVAAAGRGVGYGSEAAFSRAFKRFVGVTPARWRQTADRAPERADGSQR